MAELPEQWSQEFVRKRPVRIKYRRGDGFEVKPEFEAGDGLIVHVHYPRIMESAEEGGHSLYAGCVCWDVVESIKGVAAYLCEGDFEWLPDHRSAPIT